jgi:hypothetical protein
MHHWAKITEEFTLFSSVLPKEGRHSFLTQAAKPSYTLSFTNSVHECAISFINNKIYFRIISILLLANLELYKTHSTYKKELDNVCQVALVWSPPSIPRQYDIPYGFLCDKTNKMH